MRHRKDTLKLGRTSEHRKALFANQVSSLILSGAIKTTVVKAKASKRLADRMVTLAKKGTLHHRRLAVSKLRDETAVAKLFLEIGPKFSSRNGGYTRIIRLGNRRGDAAEICLLQWVEETVAQRPAKKNDKAVRTSHVPEKDLNPETVEAVQEKTAETVPVQENKA